MKLETNTNTPLETKHATRNERRNRASSTDAETVAEPPRPLLFRRSFVPLF